MSRVIRIGTRDSQLALWQANTVKDLIENLGYKTKLVPLKSTGDIILHKPLYELGITGIFTKTLDIAMLNEDIDIAVHSLKDVPTILPKGIVQAAVLKRGNNKDLLVYKDSEAFLSSKSAVIATGSLRRKAQWLHKYPSHKITNLRGNVNSRLQKLKDNNWNAAIFAAAGLERINVLPKNAIELDWMIPAPSQGAIMITALADDNYSLNVCKQLNDKPSEICTYVERSFLNTLEGGCTAPIGAYANIKNNNTITLEGVLLNENGTERIHVKQSSTLNNYKALGKEAAHYILDNGGLKIMSQLKTQTQTRTIYSSKELNQTQQQLINKSIIIKQSNAITVDLCKIDSKVLKSENENIIITSKNAVKSLLKNKEDNELHFNNIYCVGRRTKKYIETHNIGTIKHTANNAEALANYIKDYTTINKATYFCSNVRLDALPLILKKSNIKLNEVVAYKTTYNSPKLTQQIDGAMFYSPSTVKSFIANNKTNCIAFCIGPSTAEEAKKYFKEVRIAKVPTIESVIELINEHYV